MFRMTTDPVDGPDEPQVVTVGFRSGNPVSVDGVEMGPVELLTLLNEIGGLEELEGGLFE